MKENSKWGKKIWSFLRVLIAAYLVTGLLLLLLALILYKWEVSEALMTGGTIVIYIVSCLFAGILIGKSGRKKAFAWGLLAGATYYLILLCIAILIPQQESASAFTIMMNLGVCAGSGMVGAMVFR